MPNQLQNIFSQASSINWFTPSWDIFIILFFIVAAFLYGLSLGLNRILVILISIYLSLALINYFPFTNTTLPAIKLGNGISLQVTLFIGVVLILFFFLSRSALLKAFGKGSDGSFLQILLFSILHVGLLISVALSYMPEGFNSNLSPLTHTLFLDQTARFVWIFLPILAMVVLGRVKSKSKDLGYS